MGGSQTVQKLGEVAGDLKGYGEKEIVFCVPKHKEKTRGQK